MALSCVDSEARVNKCGGFFCVGKHSHFYLDELLYLYVKLGKNGKQIKCTKHTLMCRGFKAEGWLGTVRPVVNISHMVQIFLSLCILQTLEKELHTGNFNTTLCM